MPYKCKYCDRIKHSEKDMIKPLEKSKCKECRAEEIRLFGRELRFDL